MTYMSLFDEFAESLSEKTSPTKVFGTTYPAEPKAEITTIPAQVSSPKEEYFKVKSTQETIDRLATAGSKAISKAREIYENIKSKLEHREMEKLEKEITELEEEKKRALEEAGLKAKKEALEKELAELKKPKLESVA